ncbi:MAG TPA: MerR family transcriptional regulator, partial [Candidatus Binataceae bacterium]|nr:MerR family transcriptional regulator [Candidatus Binataceae bacterium]
MASVIRAFSAFHVCRLTGLSLRQLSYWDNTEFFSPYYAFENRRSPFSRVYSFEDLVGLRVISILRNERKIPLQTLRRVAEELSHYHSRPWSGLVLYVVGKAVYFKEPDSDIIRKVGHPQRVFPLAVDAVTTDMQVKADALRVRRVDQI